jgi:hypothetical protein
MSTANPILQSRVDVRAAETVRKFAADVGALIDQPINDVYFTAGTQVATARPVTCQVRDRRKNVRSGRQIIAVWAATTAGGAPSGTPTFDATPTSGTQLHADGSVYIYLTDADGKVVVDVDSAAATLYFNGVWLGRPKETALVWA